MQSRYVVDMGGNTNIFIYLRILFFDGDVQKNWFLLFKKGQHTSPSSERYSSAQGNTTSSSWNVKSFRKAFRLRTLAQSPRPKVVIAMTGQPLYEEKQDSPTSVSSNLYYTFPTTIQSSSRLVVVLSLQSIYVFKSTWLVHLLSMATRTEPLSIESLLQKQKQEREAASKVWFQL